MHTDMEARACDLAEYLLANNTTVRAAAKQFGVSKSTVHKDLTERLEKINPALYQQVRQLLVFNNAVPPILCPLATRRKFQGKYTGARPPGWAAAPRIFPAKAEMLASKVIA